MEFEFNRFKKVLDSVDQSGYHDITQYTSSAMLSNISYVESGFRLAFVGPFATLGLNHTFLIDSRGNTSSRNNMGNLTDFLCVYYHRRRFYWRSHHKVLGPKIFRQTNDAASTCNQHFCYPYHSVGRWTFRIL